MRTSVLTIDWITRLGNSCKAFLASTTCERQLQNCNDEISRQNTQLRRLVASIYLDFKNRQPQETLQAAPLIQPSSHNLEHESDIECIADVIQDEDFVFTLAFIDYVDGFRFANGESTLSSVLHVSMTGAITRALDYLFRSLVTSLNEQYQSQRHSRMTIVRCFTRLWLRMKSLSRKYGLKYELSKSEPERFILALFRACLMHANRLVGCVEFDDEVEEDVSCAVVESIHAIIRQNVELTRRVLSKAVTELQRWAEMKIPPSFTYQPDNHPLATYLLGVGYMRCLLNLLHSSFQSHELLEKEFWHRVHGQLSELAAMHFTTSAKTNGTLLEHNVEVMCRLFMVTNQIYQRLV